MKRLRLNQLLKAAMVRVTVVSLLILVSCASDDPLQVVNDVSVSNGYAVTEFMKGLDGPTQIAAVGDNRYVVAELGGEENAQGGNVLLITIKNNVAATTPLYENLDKPTGVVVAANGDVYVMERQRLSVGNLDGEPLEVLEEDMPFNGRSQGTLTVSPAGTLFYNTSGSQTDGETVDGSGVLWQRDGNSEEPAAYATGFKHAYAHHFDNQETLWVTEVADGSFDGQPAADKLLHVKQGEDGGWPACVGNRRPVAEYGATDRLCESTISPHTVFEPGATPTSVTTSPWDTNVLFVTLWNSGQVVAIKKDEPGTVANSEFLTGVEHPQHLLGEENRLLVVDHTGGRILVVTPR